MFPTTPYNPPVPPPSASKTYLALHTTAVNFVRALDDWTAESTSTPTITPLLSLLLHPDFTHTWGHNHFIATHMPHLAPYLSSGMDSSAFLKHLSIMQSHMKRSQGRVNDIFVDEVTGRVVLRASLFIELVNTRKVEEGDVVQVENDMVWFLDVEVDREQEVKVKSSVEFLDAGAVLRVMEVMGGGGKGSVATGATEQSKE
jgi:hypothetical protein